MRIETQRKSTIGLLAVDESVYYLRNESRFTNEKVIKNSNQMILHLPRMACIFFMMYILL